ncbi:phospholipase D-like domain-containing protein [Nonomuraea roseola]|uniref:Phospholipase D-like domain-containing protein n=1 Tax=Nonomuraea roseola TaxID=46179 RepID=A0ABV5QGD6_9ACTN
MPDGDYSEVAAELIRSAYRRCLCSLFIVDISPVNDHDLRVSTLLDHLARGTWYGADVRLLIGGSHSNIAIAEASYAALGVAKTLGIATRWLSAQPRRGSHIKLVVVDDRLLLGSHNWSGGALGGQQRQDSLLIMSADLAEYYSALFDEQWNRAGRDVLS